MDEPSTLASSPVSASQQTVKPADEMANTPETQTPSVTEQANHSANQGNKNPVYFKVLTISSIFLAIVVVVLFWLGIKSNDAAYVSSMSSVTGLVGVIAALFIGLNTSLHVFANKTRKYSDRIGVNLFLASLTFIFCGFISFVIVLILTGILSSKASTLTGSKIL